MRGSRFLRILLFSSILLAWGFLLRSEVVAQSWPGESWPVSDHRAGIRSGRGLQCQEYPRPARDVRGSRCSQPDFAGDQKIDSAGTLDSAGPDCLFRFRIDCFGKWAALAIQCQQAHRSSKGPRAVKNAIVPGVILVHCFEQNRL